MLSICVVCLDEEGEPYSYGPVTFYDYQPSDEQIQLVACGLLYQAAWCDVPFAIYISEGDQWRLGAESIQGTEEHRKVDQVVQDQRDALLPKE